MDYYDQLFMDYKVYMLANSIYAPTVLKKPMATNPVYPQVVMSEITNSDAITTIDRGQNISTLGYEVDTFSANKVIGGKTVDNMVICRELAKWTNKFMFQRRFKRVSQTPTPVIDTTLYRIVSRYTAQMFDNFYQIL